MNLIVQYVDRLFTLIAALIEAINNNTKVQKEALAVRKGILDVADQDAEVPEAVKPRPVPVKEKRKAKPESKPAPVPTPVEDEDEDEDEETDTEETDTEETDASDDDGLGDDEEPEDVVDVAVIREFVKTKVYVGDNVAARKAALKDLLKKYGAANIPVLRPEQTGAFFAEVKKLATL